MFPRTSHLPSLSPAPRVGSVSRAMPPRSLRGQFTCFLAPWDVHYCSPRVPPASPTHSVLSHFMATQHTQRPHSGPSCDHLLASVPCQLHCHRAISRKKIRSHSSNPCKGFTDRRVKVGSPHPTPHTRHSSLTLGTGPYLAASSVQPLISPPCSLGPCREPLSLPMPPTC